MEVPLNGSSRVSRSPLELCKMKLYSTGVKGKVYTDHFYKLLNHNFGIEIAVRNNTRKTESAKVTGCLYDITGNTILKWHKNMDIMANHTLGCDFYVENKSFSQMKEGEYKIKFWINNTEIPKQYFYISNK